MTILPPLPGEENTPSAADVQRAQNYVNTIVRNDEKIIKNLMVSAYMVAHLEQKGVDCSAQKAKIREIYEDFAQRQQLLRNGCDTQLTSFYGEVLDPYLAAIVNKTTMPKVGVAPLVVVLCVVVAIVSTAAVTYFTSDYQEAASRSNFRLKESETVKKGLIAIEESYGKDFVEEFKKDIEKQADKHTAAAIVKDHFSSFLKGAGKWLLYGGLALGALWLWANYGGNFKKKW